MRIAFDASALLSSMSKNRGIGNYSYGQFYEMMRQDTENEYFFFNMFEPDFDINEFLEIDDRIKTTYLSAGPGNALFVDVFSSIAEKIVRKFIADNQIDVFYITSPFDGEYIKYQAEWFEGVKVIALVYDIIPYVFKERYLPSSAALKSYLNVVSFLRKVDRIQVISQSVKDDLISYLDFDGDKIDVIWGAVDKRYKEIDISEAEKNALFDKFGVTGKYIMCTGGDDNRKNIAGLIEAYADLPRNVIDEYQLVIVCKLSPESQERYTNLSIEKNIKGRVVLTNFVSNEELLQFYNLATLMAFPSTYEGFGLPVVEAWACGTPVLTANNSSLVQIAGEGAVIVNPFDTKDVTRGLQYALTECDLDDLLKKGKIELQKYQWANVAKASLDSIRLVGNAIKDHRNTNRDNDQAEVKAGEALQTNTSKREKIAFFTPLPPLQSGISDYSADIIVALSEYVDMDIYIDDGYQSDCDFGEHVKVYNHRQYKSRRNQYLDTIYQVGNSAFHVYMFPYIKKYSGTVVLHDYNLHGVLIHMCFASRPSKYGLYKKILLEDYDRFDVNPYVSAIRRRKGGFDVYQKQVNGFVTKYANKIIVHSIESKKKLLTKNIGLDVEHIWHYAKPEERAGNSQKMREKLGYTDADVVVAAFGHIHETKRTIPTLKAIRSLRETNANVKMLFVGKLSESIEKEFHDFVKNNHMEDCVKVTGYIELDEFVDYIDATDICLNLRYPYNGETSGSLMRFFAKGKCVIVNDIGSFGEFPEGVCVKLPSVEGLSETEEVDCLVEALNELIQSDEKKQRYEACSLAFAKDQLALNKIAKKYYELIKRPRRSNLTEKEFAELLEVCSKNDDFNAEHLANTMLYIM